MDRSGDRQLDALIDAFLARDPEIGDWANLTQLTDPEEADGWCQVASEVFVEFLAEAGVPASTYEISDEPGLGLPSFVEAGYADRWPGDDRAHTVVYVPRPDDIFFLIDWTSSQLGYDSFPLVQRCDDAGSWQRDW
jgi:hypothetical protein